MQEVFIGRWRCGWLLAAGVGVAFAREVECVANAGWSLQGWL